MEFFNDITFAEAVLFVIGFVVVDFVAFMLYWWLKYRADKKKEMLKVKQRSK